MKHRLFLFILMSTNLLYSQNTLPQNYFSHPLRDIQVISNFCEFRNTHFHAGLDYRAPMNTPVYAIADGYVSRIKIEPSGYGKALYLTHRYADSGFISVYGHLNYFTKEIDKWIKDCQYERKTFRIDTNLVDSIFRFRKGEIIGYVGNRGRSYGPHLHFEIRNLNDDPYNPFLFGLKVADSRPPAIKRVAIYAANDASCIENNSFQIYDFGKIPNLINVSGSFFIGVEAEDRIDATTNLMGHYETLVFVDDTLWFHSVFDKISYENVRDYYSIVDYRQKQLNKWYIQRCIVEDMNEKKIYRFVRNKGIISFSDTAVHTIRIVARDFSKNSSQIKLKIRNNKCLKIDTVSNKGVFIDNTKTNTIEMKGLTVVFPEKSLFQSRFLNFDIKGQGNLSFVYEVGDILVPLKTPIELIFDVRNIEESKRRKIIACGIDEKNKKFTLLGTVENNLFRVITFSMGSFFLDFDTTAPTIKPFNFNNQQHVSHLSSLKLKAKDTQTGLSRYNAYINDQWVLLEYDAKNDLLEYEFDERTPQGKFRFTVVVQDGVGNMSIYEANLIR